MSRLIGALEPADTWHDVELQIGRSPEPGTAGMVDRLVAAGDARGRLALAPSPRTRV